VRFVVVGRRARASADFSLDDLPSSSGRLDVLLRCIRAAMLVSHGVRRDATVYLVLGGGPRAPRVLRVDGASAKFLRPDERSLAILARKSLAVEPGDAGFITVRPGVAVASGSLDVALDDLGTAPIHLLDPGGADLREAPGIEDPNAAFVLGDDSGFDTEARQTLTRRGARTLGVGPVGLHAEDVIAIVVNEIDRRARR
jgi:tRNA (pseudouridine54-N1)-methyltransferase